jgi:hypothetical protein
MVSCPILPSILIAKNLLNGSLKNRSIDNLETQKKSLQALLSGEDCVAVLPTGYGKPELSILNFPVRGSGDLIRQLKGHEKMTCKPYLSDPDDMKIESGV